MDSKSSTQIMLTKRDVAKRCAVSLRTVNSWISRRLIGHVKLGGGAVRFMDADVAAFVGKYRIGTRSP